MEHEIMLEPMIDLEGTACLMVTCSCDWYTVIRSTISAGQVIAVMTNHWRQFHEQ